MKKLVFIIILLCFINSEKVCAMTVDEYDFDDIEQFLAENDETSFMSFEELLNDIMVGDINVSDSLIKRIKEELFGEFGRNKGYIIMLIVIAVSSAVFVSFTAAFENTSVSKTAVFITRLVNVSVLIAAFGNILTVIEKFMERLVEMMNALLPAYVFSVTFSTGTATGAGLKQMAMLSVMLVDRCLLMIIIPMIRIYVVMSLVNSVSGAVSFKKMCQLMKTVILWLNNTLIAFVMGLNVIKNMVSPYADQAANAIFNKAVSFIPGIGSGVSGISEMIMSTGKFIRNSIGAAGLVIVAVICLFPILKMALFSMMYKLCGALLEPVADSKIADGISCIGDGVGLLMKISFTGALMFMITIGMACL